MWFLAGMASAFGAMTVLRVLMGTGRRWGRRRRAQEWLPPPFLNPQMPLYENMESAWWLNRALGKMWNKQSSQLAAWLVERVLQPLMDAHRPAYVNRLVVKRLTLGRRAPQVHNVKTFRTNSDSSVIIDFDVDWISSFAELTVGYSLVGADVPLLRATNVTFRGKMRLQLHLSEDLFRVQSLSVAFVEAPTIDLCVEPVASGLDVMNIPTLSGWLRNLLSVVICKQILWPKRYTKHFDRLFSDLKRRASARGKDATARASTRKRDPSEEFHEILSEDQMALPVGGTELETMKEISDAIGLFVPSMKQGRPRKGLMNKVRVGLRSSNKISHPPGTIGILQIRLCEASQLGGADPPSQLLSINPYVSFRLGAELVSSQKFRRTNYPMFDEHFELFVTDFEKDILEVRAYHEAEQVVDKVNMLFRDKVIGSAWISVEEVANEHGWVDLWLPLKNGDDVDPRSSAAMGYIHLQLSYDEIHDPNDVKADREVRRKFRLRREREKASLSVPSPVRTGTPNGQSQAGTWQIHLLEGCQWRRENVIGRVMDSRVDFRCGKVLRRSTGCYDTKNPSWGEYFEFPVYNPLVDVVEISGFDEDPFAQNALVGGATLALSGIGDVEPREIWVRLKMRSGHTSDSGSVDQLEDRSPDVDCAGGWVRLWVGYSSLYQDCSTEGTWLASKTTVIINPPASELRVRQELVRSDSECSSDSSLKLLNALENLNPMYLARLMERLPRSMVKFGAHVMWDRVWKPIASLDSGEDGESAPYRVSSASSSLETMTSLSSEEDHLREALESGQCANVDTVPYLFTFKTGSVSRGGTNARIWLELTGENDESAHFLVDRDGSEFQAGSTDRLLVDLPRALGKPSHLSVGHDNGGLSPDWFLESITVSLANPETKEDGWHVTFTCNQWIGLNMEYGAQSSQSLHVSLLAD